MTEVNPEFDYDKYVSFDPTEGQVALAQLKFEAAGGKDFTVTAENIKLPQSYEDVTRRAFEELSQTPEGQQIIMEAASKSPDGKINLAASPLMEQWTALSSGDLSVGALTDRTKYAGNGGYTFTNASVQRVVFHELTHIARGYDGSDEGEAKAITETNAYMSKYYNETPRVDNVDAVRYDGTPRLDFNRDFRPEGYDNRSSLELTRDTLASLPSGALEGASPELQSLHETSGSLEVFTEQYSALEESGQLRSVTNELEQAAAENTQPNMETAEIANPEGTPTIAAIKI